MIEAQFNQMMLRAEKLFDRSYEDMFAEYLVLDGEIAVSKEPVAWERRLELSYEKVWEGQRWGEPWDSAWLHLTGRVPKSWKGEELCFKLDLGGEGMLFDEKGCPFFAVTDATCYGYYRKFEYRFKKPAKGGEKIDLWVEVAANSLFGVRRNRDPHLRDGDVNDSFDASCRIMRLARFNSEVWHLRMELNQVIDIAKAVDWSHYRAQMLVRALTECCDAYCEDPNNAAAARKPLQYVLKLRALDSAPIVTASGHAHLDVGWLWPVRESVRKAARTCANQLDNMERYPEYCYSMSQPAVYRFIKENYPVLWKKISARVREGRWEPVGAMWVEADCNLPSGESLIRQLLHGKNFFLEEFGIDVKNVWLPDAFGFPASLPQIFVKSGCDKFVSQKLSWNLTNRFPYHTFYWKGIDGTRIFTHFLPEDCYNSLGTASGLIHGMNNNSEKGLVDRYISLFGMGDGGGGPSEEFIQRIDKVKNTEGVPKVKFGRIDGTLDEMEKRFGRAVSEWNGELYLEMHRGTLTSQAGAKRGNRTLEQLLAAVEFIMSCLPLEEYPQDDLDAVWKTVLLNQFHDILPGSSIGKVYEVAARDYDECFEKCAAMIAQAVSPHLDCDESALTVVNSLSYDFVGPLPLPEDWGGATVNGDPVVVQRENDGSHWCDVAFGAHSWNDVRAIKTRPARTVLDDDLVLENDLVRYEFAADGRLISAIDKEIQREMLAGPANVISCYADRPNQYEAWDVERYAFNQKIADLQGKNSVREIGPVRSTLKFTYDLGQSSISQTVVLGMNSKRLDFVTRVDWQEERKMLRVAFPVAVESSEATFDIPYGSIRRPTHDNTTWDQEKFETCGQRYADLTDCDEIGVALLNDCKYGYTIKGNIIDLNLLRSPKYPHWNADRGSHEFTYSVLPHIGTIANSDVLAQAAMLNRAPMILDGALKDEAVNVPCWLEPNWGDFGSVSLETVKKAEKEECLVVRLVENAGRTASARLHLNGWNAVVETNLLEWTDEGELPVNENGIVDLALNPFEIVTLKLFCRK